MKLGFLFTILFYTTLLHSQTQLTLNQCVEYAMLNNLEIKQSALNLKTSAINVKQAKTNLLPTLSTSIGQHYQFGRSIDRFSNTFVNQTIRSNNAGLNASLVLFNGFQNQNSIKQNELLKAAAQDNLAQIKNQIALNVASAFLQVIQNTELIKNAELQKETTTKNIERAEKMVAVGSSDLTVLLTQKAQLANEELNLVNAQNAKRAAIITLKFIMQMPVSEDIEPIVPSFSDDVLDNQYSINDLYISAVASMPQIQSAIAQAEASAMQTKVTKGLMSPTIAVYASLNTVFSQNAKNITNIVITGAEPIGLTETSNERVLRPTYAYQTETISFAKQLKENLGQSAGFNFSWNLFSGFLVQNQIQMAKINQDIAQINLTQVQNALLTEISNAHNNYEAAKLKYKATQNSVSAQKTSLDYIQKRFDAGVSNSFDVIQSKNNYNMAVSNEIQAKYDLIFRALILSFYKNNTISL